MQISQTYFSGTRVPNRYLVVNGGRERERDSEGREGGCRRTGTSSRCRQNPLEAFFRRRGERVARLDARLTLALTLTRFPVNVAVISFLRDDDV